MSNDLHSRLNRCAKRRQYHKFSVQTIPVNLKFSRECTMYLCVVTVCISVLRKGLVGNRIFKSQNSFGLDV